jgi:MFS family permease
MTDVGQGWLMTTLGASAFTVALLSTVESLPFFLLSLPAGALADVVDRRRLLITAQVAMSVVSATLALVTAGGHVTPALLLLLAGAMGTATSINGPAWFSLPSEILPRDELPAGIALNGVGFNIARVAGPALGGLVVLWLGPAAAFTVDAVGTLGVIAVLVRWRRERTITVLPGERILGAIKAGLRFARHTPALQRVLLRAFTFMSCGCVVLALLPVLARDTGGGPLAYGVLFGSLGVGAILGAAVLPRVRKRWSIDRLIGVGSVIFGLALLGMAFTRELWLLGPIFVIAGTAWMAVLSTLNVAGQNASPAWVRGRALSVYLVVFQAGAAGGSALWGAVATARDVSAAFAAAGVALLLGTLALSRVRLAGDGEQDHSPARHWPMPLVAGEPDPESGPVFVQIEYRVDPARAAEFVRAARSLEPVRRRGGAVEWWLLRDAEDPGLYVEVFASETWAEHLRQHDRVSVADRDVELHVRGFLLDPSQAPARHLIAPGGIASMSAAGAAQPPEPHG